MLPCSVPPQNYLKPTIGMDGALTHCLYTQLPEPDLIKTVTVTYCDGGEERITLHQALANAGDARSRETCHIYEEDGIYTVQMNEMVMGDKEDGPYTPGDDVIREQFLTYAITVAVMVICRASGLQPTRVKRSSQTTAA